MLTPEHIAYEVGYVIKKWCDSTTDISYTIIDCGEYYELSVMVDDCIETIPDDLSIIKSDVLVHLRSKEYKIGIVSVVYRRRKPRHFEVVSYLLKSQFPELLNILKLKNTRDKYSITETGIIYNPMVL